MSAAPSSVDPYDITVRSNGLRRRRAVEKVFGVLALLSALLACAILAIVLATLVYKGFSQLSLDFFTQMPKPVGEPGGGMANAIVGTLIVTGLGSLMAIPIGIVSGVYMSEYAGSRLSSTYRHRRAT